MAYIMSSEFSFLRAFSEQTWHRGFKCSYGGRHFLFFAGGPMFFCLVQEEKSWNPQKDVWDGTAHTTCSLSCGSCSEDGSCKLATSPFQFLAAAWVPTATSTWVGSFSNSIGSSLLKTVWLFEFVFSEHTLLNWPRFSVLLCDIFLYVSIAKFERRANWSQCHNI